LTAIGIIGLVILFLIFSILASIHQTLKSLCEIMMAQNSGLQYQPFVRQANRRDARNVS